LPRAIPSAVDPHAVERAWPRAPRWSALPDVRPWRPGVGLLGFAWVAGGRDGAPSQKLEAPPPEAWTGSRAALARRLDSEKANSAVVLGDMPPEAQNGWRSAAGPRLAPAPGLGMEVTL
jgi:hypothetical protein